MQALAFRDTQFEIIDRDGNPWLRANQIGLALGYSNPRQKIHELYTRNADEFTEKMTALIRLPDLRTQTGDAADKLPAPLPQSEVTGQMREVRIFSLRGAHLLGMFARTEPAKEFRRWVLDVLEGVAEIPAKAKPKKPKAIAGAITEEQQSIIRALVKNHLETLPKEKQGAAARKCWGSLSKSFACKSYKDIPAEQFSEAVSLLSRRFLEGEFLGKEPEPKPIALNEFDLAMLYTFSSAAMQLCDMGERMQPAIDALRPMALFGVNARLESCRLAVSHFYKQMGPQMEAAAQKEKLFNEWMDLGAAEDRSRPIIRG